MAPLLQVWAIAIDSYSFLQTQPPIFISHNPKTQVHALNAHFFFVVIGLAETTNTTTQLSLSATATVLAFGTFATIVGAFIGHW